MRYTNLYTGKKIMTEQNALRHYISKAVKAKKHGNFEEMHKIYNDANFQSFIDGMIAELNERQHIKSKEQH